MNYSLSWCVNNNSNSTNNNIICKSSGNGSGSKSKEKQNLTVALDEIYLISKLDKQLLRYYLVRYGVENTKLFLRKYKTERNSQAKVLSETYGITDAQIKFEIEYLNLNNPMDFIGKRHNYIGLLDKRKIRELYNILECIFANLNYSAYDVYVELYKINLISKHLQPYIYNISLLQEVL